MARFTALLVASAIASSNAFAPSTNGPRTTSLQAGVDGKIAEVKSAINGMTKENFSETLTTIEPFLLNDAGVSIYKKSIRRIQNKAKVLSVDVPADYAKEAKCTEKRRNKQNEFIAAKEAERKEAEEAAAAEAAAAAEEGAVAEEASE